MIEIIPTILNLAEASSLADFEWSNGRAPIGYVKGMALCYGRLHTALKEGNTLVTAMAQRATHDESSDALAWYSDRFISRGMSNSVSGPDTLRHLVVLMTGLGMRESSGRFCEGRDRKARTRNLGETAEAGLFQTSWNARRGCPQIIPLLESYKTAGDDPEFFGPIFHEGVHCSEQDLRNFGTGDGREFQRISKASPMFAVLCAGIGMRMLGGRHGHWGPLQRREAQLSIEADVLFKRIAAEIDGAMAVAQR